MKAFSLIELLVVITIIGILAAIAVPTYKTYSIKQKIATSYVILKDFRNALLTVYATKSSFPSSFSYGGVTIANNSYGVVNLGSIKNLRYMICSAPGAIYTEAALTGLNGIAPTYVDSPANNAGVYASIRMVTILTASGALVNYCGLWVSSDNISVPTSFIPPNCPCVNLNSVCQSGIVNSPC